MKKLLACALFAFGIGFAFAGANDLTDVHVVPVLAPSAINANVTNSVSLVAPLNPVGLASVLVTAPAAIGRTIDVSVFTTNAVAGGWSLYAYRQIPTNAVADSVYFPTAYLTHDLKITVSSTANTTASAVLLHY